MQSGYGGVSEIQQFMVDSCPPSLFSISPPPPPPNTSSAAADIIHSTNSTSTHHHHHKFHPLLHPHPHPPPHPHHNPPPQFAHFHPIPITQQLFQQTHQHHHHHQQQQHQHQFQLFHQQLGLDHESGPENSTSPARMMGGGGGPPFLAAAMNFKLGHLDEGSCGGGGGSRDGLNEDDGILHGGGGADDGSESRLHPWDREDDHHSPNIKEPFWRPLDIDYTNRSKKRPSKDQQPDQISNTAKFPKKTKEHTAAAAAATADSNYKLFSELEAIYKPGSIAISSSGGGGGNNNNNNNNNQTGSGSALTVDDDNPILPATAPGPTIDHQPDHASDTSNGGDAPPPPMAAKLHKGTSSSSGRRKRAKRKKQQQLSSITAFFETLVKQLMDHQEGLHRKFLEVMERRDQERTFREETWRKQEAAKSSREAAARAQEQALAAGREAAIVSFIEKITGESLNLPSKPQLPNELQKDQDDIVSYDPNCNALEPYIGGNSYNCNYNNNNSDSNISVQMNSSRWPKAEVQALIKVRSGFEVRFQEPGLKGPLWEEVSTTMGAMGYHRSAKRCKEKWENINKYFRKTKDSGKKRPQHSKTCPYFHQLDQLYSKSPNSHPSPAAGANASEERKDNSELLDAIVVSNDHQSFKFPEMGATRIELSSEEGKKRAVEAGGGKGEGNEANIEEEDDDDNDNDDGEEEGGEGQGQDQGQAQNPEGFAQDQDHHHYHHRRHQRDENAQHDSNLFFHRLRP